ncbi:MAG: ABC transporter substrate-binding protein [Actinomycetota bacterium]|nr:ABC transporter substrate-binding protein [Actinomycetota bacterium]
MGRRVTRQEFLLMSAGAGAGLALAGCGGGPQSNPAVQGNSAGSGKTYKGPKVTLDFWNGFTGGDKEFIQHIVQQFNSQTKNIDVKMNIIVWATYYQKVPTAVASGKGPDVGIMHCDQLATNAARQVILPLDDVAKTLDLKKSDFYPTVWDAGIYNGRRYGIPLDMHPLVLYYNKDLLAKVGTDKPPETKDEYMSVLKDLKAKGIQGSWVSPFLFTGVLQFMSLLWQYGGDLYNSDVTKATFNSDAGVEALSWMVSLVKDGYSPKNVAENAEFTAFQNGKNALNWNGIWNIPYFGTLKDLNWGVAPLPKIGGHGGAWSNTHQFVMMTQQNPDPNKQAASKYFINWISERSLEWAKSGKIPARKSVRDSQAFKQELPKEAKVTKELPYIHFPPTVPGIADVETASFDVAVNEAVLLKKAPKPALDEAATKANGLLKENRQKYQG